MQPIHQSRGRYPLNTALESHEFKKYQNSISEGRRVSFLYYRFEDWDHVFRGCSFFDTGTRCVYIQVFLDVSTTVNSTLIKLLSASVSTKIYVLRGVPIHFLKISISASCSNPITPRIIIYPSKNHSVKKFLPILYGICLIRHSRKPFLILTVNFRFTDQDQRATKGTMSYR